LLRFYASIAVANAILASITFHPQANYFVKGTRVLVSVDDLGNVGRGGPLTDSLSCRIVVPPVNDAPLIRTPSPLDSLFILDEGSHINGAMKLPGKDEEALQTGFEVWAFREQVAESDHSLRSSYGVGQLDWLRGRLADVHPGVGSSHPAFFTPFRGEVFFAADDGEHGAELWLQSRNLGAQLLVDLNTGAASANPSYLTVWKGSMYFAADGVDTSWMVVPPHRDVCDSFRRSGFDSRVHFAVSDEDVWQPHRRYDCLRGFHWTTTAEGFALLTSNWNNESVTHSSAWHVEAGAESGLRHGSAEVWMELLQSPGAQDSCKTKKTDKFNVNYNYYGDSH
jgi:ELWxxDGT repeat protein